jgi:ectoine hydroxylase-related dioxygenase (phytanoyl-CoA dioxygenase family)
MTAIRGDRQIEAEFIHRPEAGDILLWPAFLLHFVHPNLSDERRISISFNATLKWSDDYLPRQD